MTELPEIENNETDERSHLWLSAVWLRWCRACDSGPALFVLLDNGFDGSRFLLLSEGRLREVLGKENRLVRYLCYTARPRRRRIRY